MILTLGFIGVLALGIILLIVSDEYGKVRETGSIITLISGVVTFVLILALVFSPIGTRASIAKFESVKNTLDLARQSQEISKLELVTIQKEVLELNKWLASSKYWAKHKLTNWFWPREIFALEPIE